jgi:hypothetical protein
MLLSHKKAQSSIQFGLLQDWEVMAESVVGARLIAPSVVGIVAVGYMLNLHDGGRDQSGPYHALCNSPVYYTLICFDTSL